MEKKKLVRTYTPNTVAATEKTIQELNKTTLDAETVKSPVKRINMDMPQDLYQFIEEEVEETGQTVKGFFVALVKQHFRAQGKLQ